jgi:hypothetical protein
LGFAPLGVSHRSACRGLHRDSSYVLGDSADGGHPSRVHLRVSITEQLPDTLPCRTPSGVLAPSHVQTFEPAATRAMSSPHRAPTITGEPDRILGLSQLYRSRLEMAVPTSARVAC